MSDSIFNSVKKSLGLDEDYEAFDSIILLHINGVFATLNQLGIGPTLGFSIQDATPTWDAFLGTDLRMNFVKTYLYLKVRMLFDPPTTSYLIEALNKQASELEWRISVYREETEWVDPNSVEDLEDVGVIDGGTP